MRQTPHGKRKTQLPKKMSYHDMEKYEIIAEKNGEKKAITYCLGKESTKEKKKHLQHQHPEAQFEMRLRHRNT